MQCPTCKREVPAARASDARSTYPFCTERCRLVDLNKWFEGDYQIDAERPEDAEADPDAPASGDAGFDPPGRQL